MKKNLNLQFKKFQAGLNLLIKIFALNHIESLIYLLLIWNWIKHFNLPNPEWKKLQNPILKSSLLKIQDQFALLSKFISYLFNPIHQLTPFLIHPINSISYLPIFLKCPEIAGDRPTE